MKKVTFVRNRITAGGVPVGKGYRIKSLQGMVSIWIVRDRVNCEIQAGDEISLDEIRSWQSYNTGTTVVIVEK